MPTIAKNVLLVRQAQRAQRPSHSASLSVLLASGPHPVSPPATVVRPGHPPISRKDKRLKPPAQCARKERMQRKGRVRARRVLQGPGVTLLEQPSLQLARRAVSEHPAATKNATRRIVARLAMSVLSDPAKIRVSSARPADTAVRRGPQAASCVPLERTGQPLALRRVISARLAQMERALLARNRDPRKSALPFVRKASGLTME